MRRAITHHMKGKWPETAAVATVTLSFEDRHRRRIRLTDDTETAFLLDLPTATLLADGDGLALEEGGFIRVRAAEEAVMEVTAEDSVHLARIAWHIGNRHTPVEVLPDGRLRVGNDHVLEHMLEGLGARIEHAKAPFSPEPGAYSGGGHGHGHSHDH